MNDIGEVADGKRGEADDSNDGRCHGASRVDLGGAS
jgi:hypothetical protein